MYTTGKKQALISLSDKKDLATLGNGLQELGYVLFHKFLVMFMDLKMIPFFFHL